MRIPTRRRREPVATSDSPAPDADLAAALEATIISLLATRADDASICPSEVARRVQPTAWRALMPGTRAAAARLVARGAITATQGTRTVDPLVARGPIRLRRNTVASLPERENRRS